MTGTSVLATTYGDGILMACDTLGTLVPTTCHHFLVKGMQLSESGSEDQTLILS